MAVAQHLPLIGAILYGANILLGISVQFRLVSTRRIHWVHHALYAIVCMGAVAAFVGLLLDGRRAWALVPTMFALALLPRFRGGSFAHVLLATIGVLGYVLALI